MKFTMPEYNIIAVLEKERKRRYEKARTVIDRLVQIIVTKYNVEKIILIGSCLDEG